MLKKMNLPNKLTMLRMLLVIVFVVFMCLPTKFVWAKYVSLGAFVVASITDFLDGYISRKKNLVTKFGKIMDPLADKMLVASGFILLATAGVIPAWMAVIIVLRDFFVTCVTAGLYIHRQGRSGEPAGQLSSFGRRPLLERTSERLSFFYRIGNRRVKRLFCSLEIYPPYLPRSDRPRDRSAEAG